MRTHSRLQRLEVHLRPTIRRCLQCGKSPDDWNGSIVIHEDHDHSLTRFGCSSCCRYAKVFIFDDEMYRQELAKNQETGRCLQVL